MTLGGGWGVVAADLCTENGLVVPKLSQEIIEKFNKILPPFWSHANPVDIVAENDPEIHKTIIEELLKWQECDAVIHMGILGRKLLVKSMLEAAVAVDKNYNEKFMNDTLMLLESFEKQFIENAAKLMTQYQKPIIGVYLMYDDTSHTIREVSDSAYKGVTFITPERAVKSLAKMYTYAQWKNT
jgi:acyl-CoA synthetase (NDP forming)